jgi:transposase
MPDDRDFRKLPPSTQAELRRVAVTMVRSGKSRIEVAEAVGVNRRFVGAWVRAFEAAGEAALAGGRRGRGPGEQKALTPRQEALMRRLIVGKCPDQLKLPFALWTREAVAQLIAQRTGIRLSLSAISLYWRPGDWPHGSRSGGPLSATRRRSGWTTITPRS